ncbi:MAG: bifunctional folylpolyglutamate synthase/dihydrofolate synthase [Microbacteriaceae bacterium]
MSDYSAEAARVYDLLLNRIGEAAPQPRLHATQRVLELLGDPQNMYKIVHITGTNGKTSTARMIEALIRSYGLRPGLLTSPHLVKVNERIVIDGEPISDEAFVYNWNDIEPYVLMADAELVANGEEPLTYFEALTVLAFASFADAPVDVAILEVGMGGEWDSTNVADADVAVFTPIGIDHADRLGSSIRDIARTKSGIIKPGCVVVSAVQPHDALDEIIAASEIDEAELYVQGSAFEVVSCVPAVGGQVVTVRGRADTYRDVAVSLHGEHQGNNAALAIVAVESLLGAGEHPIPRDVLDDALGSVSSPGRLQYLGAQPALIVDAAHNPHGAESLAHAIVNWLPFDKVWIVLGVLADKDAHGIVQALDSVVQGFIVTQSSSERAIPADELGEIAAHVAGHDRVRVIPDLAYALEAARGLVSDGDAIIVTGSITLVGEVMATAEERGWR